MTSRDGFSFLIAAVFTFCGLSAVAFATYWTSILQRHSHVSASAPTEKRLIWINTGCISLFCLICFIYCIDALVSLSISAGDYPTFIERYTWPTTNYVVTLMLFFYVSNKYLLYASLIMRLKILFKGTAFRYAQKTFKRIYYIIGASMVPAFVALVILFFFYNVAFFAGLVYLTLDMIIPLHINWLFIKKLRQIRMYVFRHDQTSKSSNSRSDPSTPPAARLASSASLSVPSFPNSPAHAPSASDVSARDSPQDSPRTPTASAPDASGLQPERLKLEKLDSTASSVGDVGTVETKTSSREFKKIYYLTKRCTFLATIVACSSLVMQCVLIVRIALYFFVYNQVEPPLLTAIQSIFVSIDAITNAICLILSFEFATKFDTRFGKFMSYLLCCLVVCNKSLGMKKEDEDTETSNAKNWVESKQLNDHFFLDLTRTDFENINLGHLENLDEVQLQDLTFDLRQKGKRNQPKVRRIDIDAIERNEVVQDDPGSMKLKGRRNTLSGDLTVSAPDITAYAPDVSKIAELAQVVDVKDVGDVEDVGRDKNEMEKIGLTLVLFEFRSVLATNCDVYDELEKLGELGNVQELRNREMYLSFGGKERLEDLKIYFERVLARNKKNKEKVLLFAVSNDYDTEVLHEIFYKAGISKFFMTRLGKGSYLCHVIGKNHFVRKDTDKDYISIIKTMHALNRGNDTTLYVGNNEQLVQQLVHINACHAYHVKTKGMTTKDMEKIEKYYRFGP